MTYHWEESPQGPPRKYYKLTAKGEEYLAQWDKAWEDMVKQIEVIRGKAQNNE